MNNRKTVKISLDAYSKLLDYCAKNNLSAVEALDAAVASLVRAKEAQEVWIPNACTGYPETVDDLKKIARKDNIVVDDKTLEDYLTDRTRKSWIPTGSRYRIRISAIGADIKYWVARGKIYTRKENYQDGNNIRCYDEHNRSAEADTNKF